MLLFIFDTVFIQNDNTPLQTLADRCQQVEKEVSIVTLRRKWNATFYFFEHPEQINMVLVINKS